MKVRINHREVEVGQGGLLIEVLREQGHEVPSMCHLKGVESFTSCMLCVVKDEDSGKLLPSCSLNAKEGMAIVTDDEEVHQARKTALELLLSEHVGDCEAPCQPTCPAHMDIPQMNRLLARGDFAGALKVVKKDIALPAVFGRICPAPCEGACRRKPMEGSVSICLLKRAAGDADLELADPWMPEVAPATGKKVAVIGAGPAGLAAAWHLALRGHQVKLVDRNARPGGSLRKETGEAELPREVLDREIDLLFQAGIGFTGGVQVDAAAFEQLHAENDALVIASGKDQTSREAWKVDQEGVFVCGAALKPSRMAIRALGQGKEMAFGVDQFLRGEQVTGEPFRFNSRFGKLVEAEFEEYLKESVPGLRLEPEEKGGGLSREQVMEEAARCLHCDCRDLADCKLRLYADRYQARQKHFAGTGRALCTKEVQHELVIYEPSKCIRCGLCVRLCEQHGERFGFTFVGRGFEVQVAVPFREALDRGLEKVALEVAAACPTGAICRR